VGDPIFAFGGVTLGAVVGARLYLDGVIRHPAVFFLVFAAVGGGAALGARFLLRRFIQSFVRSLHARLDKAPAALGGSTSAGLLPFSGTAGSARSGQSATDQATVSGANADAAADRDGPQQPPG
jgi:hypothetical protein